MLADASTDEPGSVRSAKKKLAVREPVGAAISL
jgi:hypothetical protein